MVGHKGDDGHDRPDEQRANLLERPHQRVQRLGELVDGVEHRLFEVGHLAVADQDHPYREDDDTDDGDDRVLATPHESHLDGFRGSGHGPPRAPPLAAPCRWGIIGWTNGRVQRAGHPRGWGRWACDEGCGRRVAGVALLASLAACGSSDPEPQTESALGDNTITVSSFDFPESSLLAEIYSQAIERGGFDVDRIFDVGPRELVLPAMAAGFIEFVPEYLGTALQFLSLGAAEQTPGPARTFRDLTIDARHRAVHRAHLRARAGLERVLRHARDSRARGPGDAQRRHGGRRIGSPSAARPSARRVRCASSASRRRTASRSTR